MDKLLILITFLGWGVWHITAKLASQRISPIVMQLVFASCATCMVPIFYFYLQHKGVKLAFNATTMTGIGWAIASFFATGIATIAYSYCLTTRSVSELAPIASAYPMLVAILAIPIFGEAMTWWKAFGILLIWAGIVCMSRT